MSHLFEEKTFTHLTYCDQCKQLLWGVRKQGYKCKECGVVCHAKCRELAPNCTAPKSLLDDKKNSNSRAENYLRQLSQKTGADQVSVLPTESDTLQRIQAIISSDKLQNIVYEAATDNTSPANAYLANQAPLNPQITARNFTRFVSRCGPVFAFRDALLLLLSWENPVDTAISLFIYCAVCLYPKLIFLAPQVFLIYFILSNYPKRRSNNNTNLDTNAKHESTSKNSMEESTNKRPEQIPSTSTPSMFSLTFATLFQPASDESPEYVRNLQNIQNTMREFSDLYDWVMSQTVHFNWKNEEKTSRILQLLLISSFLLALVLSIIPTRFIFLSIGLFVYAVNTRFSKHIIRELQPYVLKFGSKKAKVLSEWYDDLEQRLKQQEEIKEISVFENQRWWPKRGYLHEMINDERSIWSDVNGTVNMPLITEIPAPKGYKWKDNDEWVLDTNGPWIDSLLGLEICVKPDDEGWVYSDKHWNISKPQLEPVDLDDGEQRRENMTRRRRWVRKCECEWTNQNPSTTYASLQHLLRLIEQNI